MDLNQGKRALVCASSQRSWPGLCRGAAEAGVNLVDDARVPLIWKQPLNDPSRLNGVEVTTIGRRYRTERRPEAGVWTLAGDIDILVNTQVAAPPAMWSDWDREDFNQGVSRRTCSAPIAMIKAPGACDMDRLGPCCQHYLAIRTCANWCSGLRNSAAYAV